MIEIHSQLDRSGEAAARSSPRPAGTVADLRPGAEARLVRIGGERSFRRRLMELGLLPGSRVRLIRRADVGGVLELEVRRSRVTLRRSEASELEVEGLTA